MWPLRGLACGVKANMMNVQVDHTRRFLCSEPDELAAVLGYVIVGIFVVAWAISFIVCRVNRYEEIEASSG